MEHTKQERLLEIFFRCLRGEGISIQKLADEYGISKKSISRDINDLKVFLAEHRELVGNSQLTYCNYQKCYHLNMEEFLSNKELLSLIEVIIGARAFSKENILILTNKLKNFTTAADRPILNELIRKELYHYTEIKHECINVEETLWKLALCITYKKEITVEYYRSDRALRTHRIRPASVMFTDYYFYLIAFPTEGKQDKPLYFRIDRIKHITEHRKNFTSADVPEFDEGLLRKRSLFMWPGKLRTIRFEFTGTSIQAVLDKLPTAKVIERTAGTYTVEADIYGDGIKMWILSQGHHIRVVYPDDFVEEIKSEIKSMANIYI